MLDISSRKAKVLRSSSFLRTFFFFPSMKAMTPSTTSADIHTARLDESMSSSSEMVSSGVVPRSSSRSRNHPIVVWLLATFTQMESMLSPGTVLMAATAMTLPLRTTHVSVTRSPSRGISMRESALTTKLKFSE